MTNSNEDINEYVTNTVRDILTERETKEHSVVTEKTREYRINKYYIERRLKNIESYTNRKLTNYKLLEM